MTSTTTGLPDRYRPLDPLAPEERTPTGVIRSWRARDRVLNRDVALRVHTPGGAAAREWIARALTAGGLASPALAMVYDAAEGTAGTEPGGAAYVVNEWIDGTRLADRLAQGPLPEREARAVVRRLAEGVAEAHRVGLAVGGLTPEHVVLRPGGLVGLRAVPAATGTVHGDIAALGELLEVCLTGLRPQDGPARAIAAPDLAALVRRARSDDPATGLSSVDTLVALLGERPRTGPQDLGRGATALRPAPGGPRGDAWDDEPVDDLDWDATFGADDDFGGSDVPDGATRSARRRLLVLGLPLLALALVVGLGLWMGTSVLSVASSSVRETGSTVPSSTAPSSSAPAAGSSPAGSPPAASPPAAGGPAQISGVTVFDPFGDGGSENAGKVRLAWDGRTSTSWSTLTYRGSADFGNLKPGVGLLVDLGSSRSLAGVRLQTTTPGATVQIRTAQTAAQDLDGYTVAAGTTLTGDDTVQFAAPVTARYVLVWLTGLARTDGGYSADLSEVAVTTAG